MSDKPIEVFFSYAHEDEALRDKLANHLKIFERQGVISGWHDRKIAAGREWAGQIDEHLNRAQVILLLISDAFLASDYCFDLEMKRALERHDKGEARVIPIILRPCAWERAPFGKLQALPKDGRPVTKWRNRDEAFLDVVNRIEAAIAEMSFNSSTSIISGLLPPPNPNFTGREGELRELRNSLLAGEAAALVQPQAIHGLGGIGKTQLANEYAHRYRGNYKIVWWVRSEDPTTLASDYAGLAAKLDLPEKALTKQSAIVEAVKEWLRTHRDWLLIFDNVEDVKSVRDYLPRHTAGHIIITSRYPNWTGVAKPLSVKTLPLDKAIEFLCNRTGQKDEVSAETLAETLGRLPLALEQAGAYIEASGCTMARYLEIFEKHQPELLRDHASPTEYPDTVATTWSLSFQKVESENPAAVELLRLCAFFAPDDIPLDMLTAGADELPETLAPVVRDDWLFNQAVIVLRKYSLVEVENNKLSIHRLVQAVIRHALDEAAFKQWAGGAVHVVNESFPEDSDDVRTWPICAPLLPHASTVLSHAEAVQFASDETARLFNEVGLYLKTRAEYREAKRMYEHSLAIDEAALGPNDPIVAINLSNLAGVLEAQGDLIGAKALDERALAISEAAFGPNHPQVATLVNNLGYILSAQGDLAGAKLFYERAMAIDEAAFGPNHPKVAIRLNNLGDLLRAQGDLARAKALLERAIVIDEAAFGPNHPFIGIDLNNLGFVLRAQGDIIGAKTLFERSLQIFREFLGDDHPRTKTAQRNLERLEEELKNAGP